MRIVRTLAVAGFVAGLVGACGFRSPGHSNGGDPDAGVDASIDGPVDPTAWLHPWAYRKAITLHALQIEAPGDGALADFPVLISVTDPQIAASAFASGQDIVFTSDDAMTMLSSEIESFSQSAKTLVAWVKVPMLSATTDTRLYVYYGYSGVSSPPAQTPEDVWTGGYRAVWHLQQDPGPGGAGDLKDATAGNHDGTASSSLSASDSVAAKIGRGIRFDGSQDYIDFASTDFGDAFTISMWVFFMGGSNVKSLLSNSASGGNTDGFRFFVNTVQTQDLKIIFETGDGSNNSQRQAATLAGALPLSTFTHVAVAVDRAADKATIFVNGNSASVSTSLANNFKTDSDYEVARMEDPALYFPGMLDEIEVASVARSPEWLKTAYNNQSQPGSFHTLGPEEREP